MFNSDEHPELSHDASEFGRLVVDNLDLATVHYMAKKVSKRMLAEYKAKQEIEHESQDDTQSN